MSRLRSRARLRELSRAFALAMLATTIVAQPTEARLSERADSVDATSAAMRTRVYVGMWSTHIRDLNRGLGANSLIGFSHRGFFGATFINSFGNRAVSVGLQRNFTVPQNGAVTTALGYRAGIITGYDERFLGIADKLPALPFAQIVAAVDVRNFGIEMAYAGLVASVVLNWRI